ncbi:MAG: ferrochelatase [Woeseia sp.]
MDRTTEHPQDSNESLAVLLVNLGTPEAPTPAAVRQYLKEFLSDPRVVESPRWLWWLVLNGVILRVRPARSAAAYRKIWTEQGSPLLLHTVALAAGVQELLTARLSNNVTVYPAMSYGQPSIPAALKRMLQQNIRRVVVLPLYPQYASSTTGSVFDAVTAELSRQRWVPELRFINRYHDVPGYISSLAKSIREFRDANGRGERLLFSFHGIPRRMVDQGDPYLHQCQETARLVAQYLALGEDDWQLTFQSRVGGQEWLRPYTDETLESWGEQGVGNIDVVCPGFAVDCLETLEEIALQNSERFSAAGGGELRYIPCLNDRPDHIEFLSDLAERNLAGWASRAAEAFTNASTAGSAH